LEQKQQAAAVLKGASVPTSAEMSEVFQDAREIGGLEAEEEGDEEYASEDEEGALSEGEAEEADLIPAAAKDRVTDRLSVDASPRLGPTDAERTIVEDQDPYRPRTREEDLHRLLRVSSEFFDPSDPSYELKARGLYKWDRVPSPAGPHAPSEVQKDLFLDRLFHLRTFLSVKKRLAKKQRDLAYRDLAAAVPHITPADVLAADKLAQERAAKKEAERAAADKKKGAKPATKVASPALPPAEQRAGWMNEILIEHRTELERIRSHGWTWGKKERYLRVLRGLLLHKFRTFPGARLPESALEQMVPPRPPQHDLGDVLRTRRRLDKAPLYAQLEANAAASAAAKPF